jgi:hypothetical protein
MIGHVLCPVRFGMPEQDQGAFAFSGHDISLSRLAVLATASRP